jgi:plasmid stabilization system protein ParE
MRKLRIQPQARVDLLEIWHHIAKDSLEQANRVGDELDQGSDQMPVLRIQPRGSG